ncbi:PLP-dependent aminotransferase family protein [Massilia sp. 9I]|uniref:MocR-like pyridoxine biosynthesis transcription factor PdxR n=1 Tax=Massilia sp. 9I TaxID=2653152 RepID=UPI0012F22B3F|nr:PLP-dependent aminotransferase family protein [Massilia sp. 9I]VXB22708.1 DNA-binding protein [Massilia sp. 9I]
MDYSLLLADFERRHDLSGWPRQRTVHACLRAAILGGRLAAGHQLLSTRALAHELGIARNTVLYAYEQLMAEGLLLTSRRGTLVAQVALPAPAGETMERPASALSRRAQALTGIAMPGMLSSAFALGVPALDAFPMAAWRRALDRAWRETGPFEFDYCDPAGLPVLRKAIADYLQAARGLRCDPAQVVVTNGTQASLELCVHLFTDAGDTAWIENPGYLGALSAFRGGQLRTVGIAVDHEGIAPSADDWRKTAPRLIYTSPSHQYPTGGVLGMPRRLALLDQAEQAGALIIEDDYDSEFRHDGPPLPAMQGLAPAAPVIYLGTFSKTMFPAMRTGFMVLPAGLAEAARPALARLPMHGRVPEQRALAAFLASGQFLQHLRRMRRLYRERRDTLLDALDRHFGASAAVHGAGTGMHLSLGFTDAAWRDDRISDAARAEGIAVHCMTRHETGLRKTAWTGLLLGYSQVPALDIDAAVERLAGIARNTPV